jgi:nucleoside-diphosphate-sugar epimerase
MANRKTVLVAGVTGMLGHQIAAALLERGDSTVRALIRSGSYGGEKGRRLEELRGRGLQTVEGDLLAPETLPAACEGVDTVISAVQGGEDIIVCGQMNLIEAADRAGVPRMIPSDFSVDLYKLDYEDHVWLALRKRADEAFHGKKIQPTPVLQGAFMEVVVNPLLGLVNWEQGTFTYWGGGEQPCDFTAIADAAHYAAAAALDDGLTGRPLRVAGDVRTMRQLHELFQEFAGRELKARHAGTVEDLRRLIDETKRKDPANEPAYAFSQYVWAMVSGKGKLNPLDNDRYPDIRPMTMREFLSRNPSLSGGVGSLAG